MSSKKSHYSREGEVDGKKEEESGRITKMLVSSPGKCSQSMSRPLIIMRYVAKSLPTSRLAESSPAKVCGGLN